MISFTFINYMGFWRSSRTWNFEELDRSLWCRAFPTIGNWRIGIVPRSWPFMDVHGQNGPKLPEFLQRNSHQNYSICIFYLVPYHAMPYPIFGELRIRVEFTGSHFQGNQQCPSWYPLVVQVLRWFLSNRSRIQKCSHGLTDWDSTNEILGYRTTITVFAPIERTIDASWISTRACDFQVFLMGWKTPHKESGTRGNESSIHGGPGQGQKVGGRLAERPHC